MKIRNITIALIFSLLLAITNGEVFADEKAMDGLENKKDKLSYILGANIARTIVDIKDEINFKKLLQGINDRYQGKTLLVSDEEAGLIMREFSMMMQQKMAAKVKVAAQTNIIEGEAFLKENAEKEGIVITASGLQYMVLQKGEGPIPTATDKVKVDYKGTTIDGVEFDSSYKRGEPAVFLVTGVIKGWTEALTLMNVGSTYKLFIPSGLAYGTKGAGQAIGPNAVLIFEVELLGIE